MGNLLIWALLCQRNFAGQGKCRKLLLTTKFVSSREVLEKHIEQHFFPNIKKLEWISHTLCEYLKKNKEMTEGKDRKGME